jgi:predicted secreted Zn-dependent protease
MLLRILILLATLVDTSTKPRPGDSFIDWSAERRLNWDDFKAEPDGVSVNAALTSTRIDIDYRLNNREFKYKITCQFDPSKSWGRVKSDYILSHEQAHFDIAEIHARLLNKALKNYKFNFKTAKNDIGDIYQQLMTDHHNMQEQYDEETNYSRNESRQQAWKQKIADMLDDLQSYAEYK